MAVISALAESVRHRNRSTRLGTINRFLADQALTPTPGWGWDAYPEGTANRIRGHAAAGKKVR